MLIDYLLHIVVHTFEKPSVCSSVCLLACSFWYADDSAVTASVDMGIAQIESCVFEDHKVYP